MARQLKCPKCGSSLSRPDPKTQSRECICGFIARGSHEVHQLLLANGKEIAKDYINLGLSDTMVKWGISSTALYRLPEVREAKGKFRKVTQEKLLTEIQELKEGNKKVKAQNNRYHLELPVFSNEWDKEVQMKWLDIYDKLLDKRGD